MTHFPGSPRIRKGAIIAAEPLNPLASVVVFQYNPATLSRTLTPQITGGDGGGQHARFTGQPEETLDVTVDIDATDQLERGTQQALQMGIYPQLAALEMLIYPRSTLVIANAAAAEAGVVEVIPPAAPLTLFVWGPRRVLPVRLTSLTINEEAYDTDLNPIRANVSLNLRVLTYNDLGPSVGGALSLANQAAKETLATLSSTQGAATLGKEMIQTVKSKLQGG